MIDVFKEAIKQKKLTAIFEAVSLLFLCLFLVDCAITGAGKWLSIGPLSFRMLCFGLSIVFSLPLLWNNKKKLIKNPFVIMLLALWVWIAVCVLIGLINGNNRSILIGDLKGFMNLLLIPTAICLIKNRDRLHLVIKWIVAAGLALSVMIILLNCLYVQEKLGNFAIYSDITGFLENAGFCFSNGISTYVVRLYMRSCPYLVVACVLAVYMQVKAKRFSWYYGSVITTSVIAAIMVYTRSVLMAMIVAAAVTLLLYFILNKDCRKVFYKMVPIVVAAIVLLSSAIVFLCKVNFVQFAASRVLITILPDQTAAGLTEGELTEDQLGESDYLVGQTDIANEVRRKTIEEMNANIAAHPIVGNGLGKALACRENGLSEYTYQDIWSKMGLVGMLLYFAPVFYMIYTLIKRMRKKNRDFADCALLNINIAALASISVFLVVTYFNPYLNAAIGISCYVFAVAASAVTKKAIEKENHAIEEASTASQKESTQNNIEKGNN